MMQTITTTIERQWFSQIVSREKKLEYREDKPDCRKRLIGIDVPFHLKLINGMRKDRRVSRSLC
ncbi:hypothetical protein [Occallatibacter savannae]|uniref:hypothetical protein n=1 Tax=Occallatibacter savannae TaxID=1002691 RepID=UPI000D68AD86|nr:hypothetical protein [Occallatibacter savannae]